MAAMEPEHTLLGRTLRVLSVQELAQEPLTSVPDRYVRPDQDPPLMTATREMASRMEIPVIDMQRLLASSDSLYSSSEFRKFDSACKDWGFLQVTYGYIYT